MSGTEQALSKWQPLLLGCISSRLPGPASQRRGADVNSTMVQIQLEFPVRGSIILSESVPLLFSFTLSFSPFPHVAVDVYEGAVREEKERTWEQEMDIPLLVPPPTPGGLLLDRSPTSLAFKLLTDGEMEVDQMAAEVISALICPGGSAVQNSWCGMVCVCPVVWYGMGVPGA